MKQFIRTLLLSLLLTGVIGAAFWLFQQGTFFDPVVNRITMACLVLLLAIVWYLFFSNLWFHHMQREQRVLDALPGRSQNRKRSRNRTSLRRNRSRRSKSRKSRSPLRSPLRSPSLSTGRRPRCSFRLSRSLKRKPLPGKRKSGPGASGLGCSAGKRRAPGSKAHPHRICPQDGGGEGRGEGPQAAAGRPGKAGPPGPQTGRGRRPPAEKAGGAGAEAARKKSAAPKKRVDWKNGEQ